MLSARTPWIFAMPITPPSTLPVDCRPVLVAALSGRALAAAAHRAGDRVVVLDLFADRDTATLAERSLRLPSALMGFDRNVLIAAAAEIAPEMRGLVYGAGFEHDTDLLASLASRLRLLGNAPETVAAAKNPIRFAALLARLGLPHPPTTTTPPPAGGDWLAKAAGGSGGGHIVSAEHLSAAPGRYFQQRMPGRPLSALFLADGRAVRIIGFSEQWVAADAAAPFRYGGCAGPTQPPRKLTAAVVEACAALADALGLVGLNSLDLLLDGAEFQVLELNPRPGATLDVFDGRGETSLWRWHLDAVAGRLPPAGVPRGAARAAAVVYAPWDIAIPEALSWPDWAVDRGPAGTVVKRGGPVCTVTAAAATVAAAREGAERRAAQLLHRLDVARIAPPE
jgi:predicted ATP-grasp superfamily ATP-dependent carboligase